MAAVLVPAIVSAQGVTRGGPVKEVALFSIYQNSAGTTTCPATRCWGVKLGPDAWTVTGVSIYVSSASGGGAGTTIYRVSDGTSTCDCTFACADTGTTGGKRASCTGTCSFAGSSVLALTVGGSSCTTTQPTTLNVTVLGRP